MLRSAIRFFLFFLCRYLPVWAKIETQNPPKYALETCTKTSMVSSKWFFSISPKVTKNVFFQSRSRQLSTILTDKSNQFTVQPFWLKVMHTFDSMAQSQLKTYGAESCNANPRNSFLAIIIYQKHAETLNTCFHAHEHLRWR